MAVTHNITLDVDKNRMRLDQNVHVRTGDKSSQTVKCTLTKDGAAYTPASGATAKLEILKPDKTWTVTNATVSGSTVSGVVPLEAMSAPGDCKRAYFRIVEGSKEDTTEDFHLHVFPNATQEAIESKPYSDQLESLMDDLAEIVNKGNFTFADPIDWSQSRAYDEKTVVRHDGFTYISKQDVPSGTQIGNEDYWYEWSQPDAQLAGLESIVRTYDGRIADTVDFVNESFDGRVWQNTILGGTQVSSVERVGTLQLDTSTNPVCSCAFKDGYLYVGNHQGADDSNPFYIDVFTYPALSRVAHFNLSSAANASLLHGNSMDICGSTLYVSNSMIDDVGSTKKLYRVDVSNPSSPRYIGEQATSISVSQFAISDNGLKCAVSPTGSTRWSVFQRANVEKKHFVPCYTTDDVPIGTSGPMQDCAADDTFMYTLVDNWNRAAYSPKGVSVCDWGGVPIAFYYLPQSMFDSESTRQTELEGLAVVPSQSGLEFILVSVGGIVFSASVAEKAVQTSIAQVARTLSPRYIGIQYVITDPVCKVVRPSNGRAGLIKEMDAAFGASMSPSMGLHWRPSTGYAYCLGANHAIVTHNHSASSTYIRYTVTALSASNPYILYVSMVLDADNGVWRTDGIWVYSILENAVVAQSGFTSSDDRSDEKFVAALDSFYQKLQANAPLMYAYVMGESSSVITYPQYIGSDYWPLANLRYITA